MSNICSVCNKEFRDEYFDEEQNKCILHCDKNNDKWNNKDKSILNEKVGLFWDSLKDILEIEKNKINDQKKALKNDQTMAWNIEWKISLEKIKFPYSDIYTPFYFDDFREYNFFFKQCEFMCEVDGSLHSFKKHIEFFNCTFFNNVKFNRCIFNKTISFKESIFKKDLNLENTTFNENVSFKGCHFNKPFNLEETIFIKEANFLYLELNENVRNRETARIIKDSFERKNNIIEGNKYYAMEMEFRKKELTSEDNFAEKTVLNLHSLSSSYSQDWTKVLCWILILSLTATLFRDLIKNGFANTIDITEVSYILFLPLFLFFTFSAMRNKINRYIKISMSTYFLYVFLTYDVYLVRVLSFINPFINSSFKETNLISLLFKIAIAYLIYQLIISIRQNTRRK